MKLIEDLPGRYRLFILVFVISLSSALLILFVKGPLEAFVVSMLIVCILWLTSSIWLPDGFGTAAVRKMSLGIVSALLLSSTFWYDAITSLVIKPVIGVLKAKYPNLEIEVPTVAPTIEVLVFSVIVIALVNYLATDRTAMGKHNESIDKEFPEKKYKERLKSFCSVLSKGLDELNRETNWSDEFFTHLEAEVEVKASGRGGKKLSNLINALKKVRGSKVLLVLGDPGSGKSVALRKLSKELLSEVEKTGKVPIYVNLREWESEESWSGERLPTTESLYNFIVDNLKGRGDMFFTEFIDEYFRKMYEHGRLFFILDSFDEIPSVLDVDDSAPLIDSLSGVIFRFLGGAHDSRGILSSRFFRKPTLKFAADTILEIRPFSDEKIIDRFKKSIAYDPKLEKIIFSKNHSFGMIARNPFSASLILNYVQKNSYNLPSNQVDLYDSYITERLNISQRHKKRSNLTTKETIDALVDIAYFMFSQPNYGLEAPKEELIRAFPKYPVEIIIDQLCFCRLGRVGSGEGKLFSFVHRRFNEFLVAKKLISDKGLIPRDSIPTDSRWRDSLVMYCEVSSPDDARDLAEFCWDEIKQAKDTNLNLTDVRYKRAIHSLRFLNEAFRNRQDVMLGFKDQLSEFILGQISGERLLETKLTLEAVGVMDYEKTDLVISKALGLHNDWISDTALRSCRHLPLLSKQLSDGIARYLLRMRFEDVIRRKDELRFSFSLSDGFKEILRNWKLIILDLYLLAAGFFISLLTNVQLGIILGILWLLFSEMFPHVVRIWILPGFRRMMEAHRVRKARKGLAEHVDDFFGTGSKRVTMPRVSMVVRVYACWTIFFFCEKHFHNLWEMSLIEKVRGGLLILSFLLIFPWFDFFLFVKSLVQIGFRGLRGFLLQIVFTATGAAAFMLTMNHIVPEYLRKILINVVAIGYVVCIVVLVLWEWYLEVMDGRRIRTLYISEEITRDEISSCLAKFRTPKGRLEFVESINSNGICISGNWPDARVPNYGDEASTILARLEEKWLGFS